MQKTAEADALREQVKKLEKAKTDMDKQVAGLSMQVQKDCEMITMFQTQAAVAQKEADELKKQLKAKK
jgi:hypothetical protein